MSKYTLEQNVTAVPQPEQEQEQTLAPAAPETVAPAQPAPKAGASKLSVLSAVLSAAALIVALCALWRTMPPAPEQTEDPSVVLAQPGTVITYKEHQLPAYTQVPLNAYDPLGFTAGGGRVDYTKDGRKALAGVDVSFYQKDVDWNRVKAAGIDFAIIRVGFRGYGPSGTISEDSCFRQNIEGALAAGLQVGVYFFSQAINVWEAREEADFVLNAIADYDVTFPVVFDWEHISTSSARTNGLPHSTLSLCAATFCDAIEQAGYTPVIYFNQDMGYLEYDLDMLKDYDFWLAEYRNEPTFYYHFDMWQYTAKGSVPGVEGPVDLNLSFVDYGAKE